LVTEFNHSITPPISNPFPSYSSLPCTITAISFFSFLNGNAFFLRFFIFHPTGALSTLLPGLFELAATLAKKFRPSSQNSATFLLLVKMRENFGLGCKN